MASVCAHRREQQPAEELRRQLQADQALRTPTFHSDDSQATGSEPPGRDAGVWYEGLRWVGGYELLEKLGAEELMLALPAPLLLAEFKVNLV